MSLETGEGEKPSFERVTIGEDNPLISGQIVWGSGVSVEDQLYTNGSRTMTSIVIGTDGNTYIRWHDDPGKWDRLSPEELSMYGPQIENAQRALQQV